MNMLQRRYVARRIDEVANEAVQDITRAARKRIKAVAEAAKDRIMLRGEGVTNMQDAIRRIREEVRKNGGPGA